MMHILLLHESYEILHKPMEEQVENRQLRIDGWEVRSENQPNPIQVFNGS